MFLNKWKSWGSFFTRPAHICFAVLVFLFAVGVVVDGQIQDILWRSAHNQVQDAVMPLRDNLAAQVQHRLAYLDALGAYLKLDLRPADIEARFSAFAAGLMAGEQGIQHFTASPDGIIRYVYPAEGSQTLLGLNLTSDRTSAHILDIQQAMRTRRIVLSEPINSSGVTALLGRLAIYDGDNFWGFVGEVTDLEPILKQAGLAGGPGWLTMALRDSSGNVFWGDPAIFSESSVTLPVDFLDDRWQLAVMPVGGWESLYATETLVLRGLGVLLMGLLTLLAYMVSNRQRQLTVSMQERNVQLRRQVEVHQQARESLRQSEQRFLEIFQANPAAIGIINRDRRQVVTMNERMEALLGYKSEELVGKNLDQDGLWVDPSSRDALEQQVVTTGAVASVETRWRTRPAGIRDVIVSATRITLSDEECLLVMVMDITERKRTEQEREQFFQQLEAGRERLRKLTHRLVNAQEDERRRISRELHDEAGQALTALSISLEMLQAELPPEQAELSSQMGEAVELTHTTLDRIRSLAQMLRPPALDALGLAPTLAGQCQGFQRRTHIPVNTYFSDLPTLPETYNITFYRCLQEGLTNIARHAHASHVWVELRQEKDEIILCIEDDGQGMAARGEDEKQMATYGLGLIGLEERLELLAGRLDVESKPGKGTRLLARLPLPNGSARGGSS